MHLCYVRLCWRGEDFVCISPCTSIPVAIATAMGDQVSFFISSPWVLAWRPVKLVGSRRCEVWLSAGGGEEDWQLWWDWKLVLAHCFLFNVDTTQWLCSLSCIFTHPTLSHFPASFALQMCSGEETITHKHPEGTKQGALCCKCTVSLVMNY